ncbi:SWI/SNF-related matrix-associated actin-dependent regulator of chromatin [Phytophthora cinnamomi]|uniref:SWI/SNF-related matrix-associated actin-dependent regulator of chromatin n=1 Tax=Phytophthora cinnamomi TaxID=4785 RepID=UPI0035599510|nr:SWI/SNF-related matrix-associated actin-dependent regulator of chromatin [Phytophthora cinnamomi]
MNELPADLLHGDWACQREIELLQRTQAAHQHLTRRLQAMARELRGERYYPLKTETKQLRVRVYHTYVPPVEAAEDTQATPGRWTLRIEGVDASAGEPTVVKFSSYFRKASIELDPHLYSDHVVEWTSFQKASHDVDGLEVSRIGSTAHTVKIKLLAAQTPERFSISSELEAAIGQYLGPAKAYTKQDIVLAMWEYIKLRNLIKEDDCRVVVCDDRLVQVLNCVSLPFTSIVVALKQHLTPINAIDLEYTLSLSTACESELLDEKFFDVSVAATSDLDRTRARALKECEELQQDQKKELALLQAQEVDILDRLQTYTRKKEWMAQFAQDPCGFMADVKKSQVADEQILAAETELDEFNVSHPQQFTQPWVREVVGELLTTRPN